MLGWFLLLSLASLRRDAGLITNMALSGVIQLPALPSPAKRERDDIDQDAQRVLQHMYRMEEELETLREDNERLMQERTDAQGQVSRHDIAAIWVAFFSRWRRYRC